MFKFTDTDGAQVWVKPESIVSIEHVNNSVEHTLIINTGLDRFYVTPDSEEDCRAFLFSLFKAMGEEYKYE